MNLFAQWKKKLRYQGQTASKAILPLSQETSQNPWSYLAKVLRGNAELHARWKQVWKKNKKSQQIKKEKNW